MSIFGDLGSKFSKTNVRSDISTFEMGYIRNFANKIRELILFDLKCPNWAFGLEIFEKQSQI